ncbi:hypothetical protein G9A89_021538 [Geosiphon pyriformis]|nr:hypothetical protein G9A89_021538 [Geosiphon pyriformis]
MIDGLAIFGNVQHFVHNIYHAINQALWEAGPRANVLDSSDIQCIDWKCTASVWHPDSHMLAEFTSRKSAVLCTYLMKAVHKRLPVAVQKRLYNKCYLSVLCLMCEEVEFSDYAFMYSANLMYDKSKLFFDYEATVGPVIAVIKKTIKVSGSEGGFKVVVLRKKKKEGVLTESIDNRGVAAEAPGACLWSSETNNTTESENIDIEKECLVEEISIDYGESGAFMEGDPD